MLHIRRRHHAGHHKHHAVHKVLHHLRALLKSPLHPPQCLRAQSANKLHGAFIHTHTHTHAHTPDSASHSLTHSLTSIHQLGPHECQPWYRSIARRHVQSCSRRAAASHKSLCTRLPNAAAPDVADVTATTMPLQHCQTSLPPSAPLRIATRPSAGAMQVVFSARRSTQAPNLTSSHWLPGVHAPFGPRSITSLSGTLDISVCTRSDTSPQPTRARSHTGTATQCLCFKSGNRILPQLAVPHHHP
jgi:hypothetical protein